MLRICYDSVLRFKLVINIVPSKAHETLLWSGRKNMRMLTNRLSWNTIFWEIKATAVTDLTMVIASTEPAKSGSISIKAQIEEVFRWPKITSKLLLTDSVREKGISVFSCILTSDSTKCQWTAPIQASN